LLSYGSCIFWIYAIYAITIQWAWFWLAWVISPPESLPSRMLIAWFIPLLTELDAATSRSLITLHYFAGSVSELSTAAFSSCCPINSHSLSAKLKRWFGVECRFQCQFSVLTALSVLTVFRIYHHILHVCRVFNYNLLLWPAHGYYIRLHAAVFSFLHTLNMCIESFLFRWNGQLYSEKRINWKEQTVQHRLVNRWYDGSSHLIFYSLKTVVKRNCVQSSYKYTMQI